MKLFCLEILSNLGFAFTCYQEAKYLYSSHLGFEIRQFYKQENESNFYFKVWSWIDLWICSSKSCRSSSLWTSNIKKVFLYLWKKEFLDKEVWFQLWFCQEVANFGCKIRINHFSCIVHVEVDLTRSLDSMQLFSFSRAYL